jgi:hypothetical protein
MSPIQNIFYYSDDFLEISNFKSADTKYGSKGLFRFVTKMYLNELK